MFFRFYSCCFLLTLIASAIQSSLSTRREGEEGESIIVIYSFKVVFHVLSALKLMVLFLISGFAQKVILSK